MWDIVWHFETLWNIMCQHICETSAGPSSPVGEYLKHILRYSEIFWDFVNHCETFQNIVKHYVSANLWDICRAQFSGGRIFKTPFQLCFRTQNEFCHLQKTLMNRIYIAEWNLKIFHQKDSFCKNGISKIIFGQNFSKLSWAKLSGGAIFKNNVDKRSLSKSFKPQQFWRTGRVYREDPQ